MGGGGFTLQAGPLATASSGPEPPRVIRNAGEFARCQGYRCMSGNEGVQARGHQRRGTTVTAKMFVTVLGSLTRAPNYPWLRDLGSSV